MYSFGPLKKLALSTGPNRVGAPIILAEDGNIQFPKDVFFRNTG
jgi:hypothetical protein